MVAIVADPRGLRASFAHYRALDETITQNEQRRKTRLMLPVLAIGGGRYTGAAVAETTWGPMTSGGQNRPNWHE